MDGLGSVQQKVSCVFETAVFDEPSGKRDHQTYRVAATSTIKQRALENDVFTARPTEKLDGTCVWISDFEGKPWLWARFDRKPTKGAEKRFRKWQTLRQKQGLTGGGDTHGITPTFQWDMQKDFKETPQYWVPASGVRVVDGSPQPDDIGHTPGWVPVSPASRQHCWHLQAVDLQAGLAIILREGDDASLCVECVHLSTLVGHTAELIGTNINANPYGIGSKKHPIHMLVIHGSIGVHEPPPVALDNIRVWFEGEGQVEGIVWHCANGALFKVHRNHICLPWPVSQPSLTLRPLTVAMTTCDLDTENSLLAAVVKLGGRSCAGLRDLERLLCSVEENSEGLCVAVDEKS